MVTPLLTQVRPTYFSVDCGMAYLIRLSDGRFIVIDSTFGEYDEVEHLYSLMVNQNETDDKPCIAAWFFTHPHDDHTNGFIKMSLSHADDIRVEKVVYNFLADLCEHTHYHAEFLNSIARFGSETVIPMIGDVLRFADAEFKVLYTADQCVIRPVNVNESSLTMRMTLGSYSVMWLGDLQHIGAKTVMATYSPDELKSDILQVGHHGYWGSSDELNRAVDPEILLWPIPEYRYLEMLYDHPNRFFIEECNHIRHIFVSGIEETTIDMSAPIVGSAPYFFGKITADFSKKSIYSLGWACLTGGSMDYKPSTLTFGESSATLETQSSRTLLQMIQRGRTAVSDAYKFTFSFIPHKDCEAVGLIFDCPTLTTPDTFTVHPIDCVALKETAVTLTVDRAKGVAEMCIDGKSRSLPFASSEPCDIVFFLKDAKVEITGAVFENI